MPLFYLLDLITTHELEEEEEISELEEEIKKELETLESNLRTECDNQIQAVIEIIEENYRTKLQEEVEQLIKERDSDIALAQLQITYEMLGDTNPEFQTMITEIQSLKDQTYKKYYEIRNQYNSTKPPHVIRLPYVSWTTVKVGFISIPVPKTEFITITRCTFEIEKKEFAYIFRAVKILKKSVENDIKFYQDAIKFNHVYKQIHRTLSSSLSSLPLTDLREKLIMQANHMSEELNLCLDKINRGKDLEIKRDVLVPDFVDKEPEVAKAQAEVKDDLTERYQKEIDHVKEINEEMKNQEILAKDNEIRISYETDIRNEKLWLENRLRREYKAGIEFQGDFRPIEDSEEIELTELINPAGPIGFLGNCAIFYLKPEIETSDIETIISILKTPYLNYTSKDHEPLLMDPALKLLTKDYSGTMPTEDEKYEMLEYIPENYAYSFP